MLLCMLTLTAFLNAQEAESKSGFTEVWAYLMNGEERYFDASQPITDLAYFGAGMNASGHLAGVPDPDKVRAKAPGIKRVHLVVAETGNQALTHFSIDPDFPLRMVLIAEIAAAALPFDGVQIDFEAVLTKDALHYQSFLSDLKAALGSKMLSVAIPARWKAVGDPYDYPKIAAIVDRVVVMAYDEHWSTSVPGSIASLDWCRNVSSYALQTIGESKLIMGLPFYGRAWADKNPSRAYKFSSVASLISEKALESGIRKDEIPFLEYQEIVNVQVYYEDSLSLGARLRLYKNASVRSVAFWRLGQEDPEVWNLLRPVQ